MNDSIGGNWISNSYEYETKNERPPACGNHSVCNGNRHYGVLHLVEGDDFVTCKDCLHFPACNGCVEETTEVKCVAFTDKSEWVHLPCKSGDSIYHIHNGKIYRNTVNKKSIFAIATNGKLGKSCFLTKEEAEKALEERKKRNDFQTSNSIFQKNANQPILP